jgi:thiamine pyrophosphokinase
VQKFNRAIICLDGDPPSKQTIQGMIRTGDCIVAADGGANWLNDYKIKPHVLIGDLDGVRKNVLQTIPKSSIVQKKDQYSTDLEKAFTWVMKKKIKYVVVMGAAGKRIDHTLSNFSLFWKFHKKGNTIQIFHDDWWAALLNQTKNTLLVEKGMTISLIPFSNCSGITLKGFQYSLTNAKMKLSEVGISNIARGRTVEITVKQGRMLAIVLLENP